MFLLEYIKNPSKVGAIAPSSKYLAEEMIEKINFNTAKCIVEYGPGTGVFTEKILARVKEDTIVILIELNKNFYEDLQKKYGYKNNVIIINESAENIDNILKKYCIKKMDYVVSGLPFASLPKEVSENILRKTSIFLNDNGDFITFQYSLLKKNFIEKFFSYMETKLVVRNLPPAYVLDCRGVNNEWEYFNCWWW